VAPNTVLYGEVNEASFRFSVEDPNLGSPASLTDFSMRLYRRSAPDIAQLRSQFGSKETVARTLEQDLALAVEFSPDAMAIVTQRGADSGVYESVARVLGVRMDHFLPSQLIWRASVYRPCSRRCFASPPLTS
jgi:hypothetical protein